MQQVLRLKLLLLLLLTLPPKAKAYRKVVEEEWGVAAGGVDAGCRVKTSDRLCGALHSLHSVFLVSAARTFNETDLQPPCILRPAGGRRSFHL